MHKIEVLCIFLHKIEEKVGKDKVEEFYTRFKPANANSRWYDKDPVIKEFMSALERLDQETVSLLAQDFIQTMMEDEKIDLRDRPKVIEFYKQLDWEYLLKISAEIKNAYYFINKILEEGTFSPKILTTVNSLNEIKAKLSDIKKNCKIIKKYNKYYKIDLVNKKWKTFHLKTILHKRTP